MTVEVYWFSEQPYGHVTDDDLESYESGRMHFPNTYFDPEKAHTLYNNYHDQYAWADEVGFDGIMSNEHHSSYWCMKPSVNVDAAVIAKMTKRVKIAMLGNVIATTDPVRMAEEIAMLDCISGGRIISGFVRGTAVETLHAGISPTENRDRFEEAHDLILKCWTDPGPFRWEGKHYHHRMVNPWVRPIQKPHPAIWFPGTGSPESVIWAASHQYPYMNLGSLLDLTKQLKDIYFETAREHEYEPGPEHFGYLMRLLVADTDEEAQELGKHFLWTEAHRNRGPVEFNDPPGYQSREAMRIKMTRPPYWHRHHGQAHELSRPAGRPQHHRGQPRDGHPEAAPHTQGAGPRLHPDLRERRPHAPRGQHALHRTPRDQSHPRHQRGLEADNGVVTKDWVYHDHQGNDGGRTYRYGSAVPGAVGAGVRLVRHPPRQRKAMGRSCSCDHSCGPAPRLAHWVSQEYGADGAATGRGEERPLTIV